MTDKAYYDKNAEDICLKSRVYYAENKEKCLTQKKNYQSQNKQKISAQRKKFRELNPEKLRQRNTDYYHSNREKIRDSYLRRTYGITLIERNAMIEAQDHKCAICFKDLGNIPHVDHDHSTGVVRGILCNTCNPKLGWYEANRLEIEKYLGANNV